MPFGPIRRFAICGALILAGAAFAATANASTYIVLYKQHSVGSDAAATIQKAGGSLVASYPEIGVVIARSDAASFRSELLRDSRVWGAAATAGLGVQVDNSLEATRPPAGDLPNFPADDAARTRISPRTTTRRTAPTARAARRRRSCPATTCSATGRTPPARSRPRRTASESWASPRG